MEQQFNIRIQASRQTQGGWEYMLLIPRTRLPAFGEHCYGKNMGGLYERPFSTQTQPTDSHIGIEEYLKSYAGLE